MSDPNLHFCDRDSKPKFVCTYFIHIGMCVCVCVEGGHCNGNMFYHPDSKVLPVYCANIPSYKHMVGQGSLW